MYQKEKRITVTILSLLLVLVLYCLYINNNYLIANPELIYNFQFWGKSFLIMIPVIIVSMIILHIIFAILNKIITNEDIEELSDEMDKLIELKALRVSHWTNSAGFIAAMASQALGMKPIMFLVIITVSCFLSSVSMSIAQIYYYRKGI